MNADVKNLPALFREYARLDRKRTSDGLSMRELHRWTALKNQLSLHFNPGISEQRVKERASVRVPTRLKVSFESLGELRQSLMTNLSRGGVFVSTADPLEIGSRLLLRIHCEGVDPDIEVAGEVASLNTGPAMDSHMMGMGVRFVELTPEVAARLDHLYENSLDLVGSLS